MNTRCILFFLVPLLFPATLHARTNSLTLGLSTSFDYDNAQYESVDAESGTDPAESRTKDDDEYAALIVRPLVHILSEDRKGFFELKTAPGIKYDLIDSETDWDADLTVAFSQYLSRNWNLSASNSLVRSDRHTPQDSNYIPIPQDTSATSELSADRGRSRYWLNTFDISSDHPYRKDSQVIAGFNYRTLRNDEAEVLSYEDYDRTEVSLRNQHRFNPHWKADTGVSVVRGKYDATEPINSAGNTSENAESPDAETANDDALSDDLKEYHLQVGLENNTFARQFWTLNYSFIGARYDETLRNDGDLHEVMLSWRHVFSRNLETTLGAGPSYEKTEGQEANWNGNGIVEVKYKIRNGAIALAFERGTAIDNFSGTDERGFVEFWKTRLQINYLLLDNVSFNGHISYLDENREAPSPSEAKQITSDDNEEPDGYNENQFSIGTGLGYNFMKNYSATLNYTFIRQDSEQAGDDYDDHRLTLTFSWEQEFLRW